MKDERLSTFVYTFSESALFSLLSFSVAVFYPLILVGFPCFFLPSFCRLFTVFLPWLKALGIFIALGVSERWLYSLEGKDRKRILVEFAEIEYFFLQNIFSVQKKYLTLRPKPKRRCKLLRNEEVSGDACVQE